MTAPDTDRLAPWFRYLERRDSSLSDAERARLASVMGETVTVGPDVDLVREGEEPERSTLLLEGWTCRYIHLADGRRQIVALQVAGEFVDLHSFPIKRMDHSVATLTPVRIAYAPHEALKRITEEEPHLARLLWLSTLIDAAIQRQWLLGAGKRSALEHCAHLLCELYVRLEVAGRAGDYVMDVPLTQGELGDALGVSIVHANRVLQELRGLGVVTWRGPHVEIVDWDALAGLAEFDAAYLVLRDQRR